MKKVLIVVGILFSTAAAAQQGGTLVEQLLQQSIASCVGDHARAIAQLNEARTQLAQVLKELEDAKKAQPAK